MSKNGEIYLESTKRSFKYDIEEFTKDDVFITVGMLDKESWENIIKVTQEYAEIGSKVFDYDVLAPAQAVNAKKTNYQFPAQFRIANHK